MRYLVVGGSEVDAGKTTFSVGLLARLDTTGFKPRAGNDFWYDHDDCRHALMEGRLYGKDARRLAEASAADVKPEDINPIHRLWRPAPGGGDYLGRSDRSFVLDRVGDGYVVNSEAELPELVYGSLPIAQAPLVGTVDELNEQIRSRHLPHLDALATRINDRDSAVLESYGDIARPLQNVDVSRVAVVEPGCTRIYDGERYAKACEVAVRSPIEGQLEAVVGDVIEPLEPKATVRLPALTQEERSTPNRIARAYDAAYDALCS